MSRGCHTRVGAVFAAIFFGVIPVICAIDYFIGWAWIASNLYPPS